MPVSDYIYTRLYFIICNDWYMYAVQYERTSDHAVAAKRGTLRRELKNGLPTGIHDEHNVRVVMTSEMMSSYIIY